MFRKSNRPAIPAAKPAWHVLRSAHGTFLDVLHEQSKPEGCNVNYSYSILRARMWHLPNGQRAERARDHTFTVIWDDDHDERIYEVLDQWHASGLLANVRALHEHKGLLYVSPMDQLGQPFPVEVELSIAGDIWAVEVVPLVDSVVQPIIETLWTLGAQPVAG